MRSSKKPDPFPEPEGFLFHRPVATDAVRGSQPGMGLLLPLTLVDKLIVESKRLEDEAMDVAQQKRLALRAPFISLERRLSEEAEYAAEQNRAEETIETGANLADKHMVYSSEAAQVFVERVKTLYGDARKRDEDLAQRLTAAGPYRLVAKPHGDEDTGDALAALRLTHPHFREVIQFISQHRILSSRSTKTLGLPPILLNGEPGVGKTHFAIELANLLGVESRRVAFDTPITAATLMGSDRRWANTQSGLLFELVCLGQHANPVIILDEIDKADAQRDWNPIAPLHSLLEPSTAVKIRDLSVDFEFDASLVTWVATSNDSRGLSTAIRSRFTEFHIHRPGAADAIASAMEVVARAFASYQIEGVDPPDRTLAVALAHLTPREITQVLKQTVANAIAKGNSTITPDDLPAGVRDEEAARPAPKNWLH